MTVLVAAGTNRGLLDLINLSPLMELTRGRPEIVVGLIDGPVATGLAGLASDNIRSATVFNEISCQSTGAACQHGTFMAGILSARRSSPAPAICPDCTLLVCPIFLEASRNDGEEMPRATPEQLATAILHSIRAGAHVLNLSVALVGRPAKGEQALHEALNEAMKSGTVVVAAAGNHRRIGSSAITAHPWVIPVTSYSLKRRPLELSDSGASIGKRGVGAPGERVSSLTADGVQEEWTGTSVAAPFVTGAIALLWSQFPAASAGEIRFAVTHLSARRRRSIVPPLLDAWGAYLALRELSLRR